MKTKLNWMLGICLILFLASCKESKKEKAPDEDEIVIKNFANKYKAVVNWDTTAAYTSFYQRTFIAENKPLLFKGRIYDIIMNDSNYVVKVLDEREDSYNNFLAYITFNSQQLDASGIDFKSPTGVFVIKVSKVTTSNPSIKIDEASNGDDSYTYSHLSDDKDQMLTIFTGSIIDCHLRDAKKD